MWGFFRWFVAVPLAALVTAALFLLVYNQIAPEPFAEVYRSPEDADKIIIDIRGAETTTVIRCMCGWIPLRNDDSNAWTRSDKAVSEAPRVPEEKPAMPVAPIRIGPDEKSLHVCNSSGNGSGSAPVLRIAPVYPKACVEKRAEGKVVVEFDITAEGKVVNASIIDSDDRCFNAAAIKNISRWRHPPMCNAEEKPVARYDQQATIRFVLED